MLNRLSIIIFSCALFFTVQANDVVKMCQSNHINYSSFFNSIKNNIKSKSCFDVLRHLETAEVIKFETILDTDISYVLNKVTRTSPFVISIVDTALLPDFRNIKNLDGIIIGASYLFRQEEELMNLNIKKLHIIGSMAYMAFLPTLTQLEDLSIEITDLDREEDGSLSIFGHEQLEQLKDISKLKKLTKLEIKNLNSDGYSILLNSIKDLPIKVLKFEGLNIDKLDLSAFKSLESLFIKQAYLKNIILSQKTNDLQSIELKNTYFENMDIRKASSFDSLSLDYPYDEVDLDKIGLPGSLRKLVIKSKTIKMSGKLSSSHLEKLEIRPLEIMESFDIGSLAESIKVLVVNAKNIQGISSLHNYTKLEELQLISENNQSQISIKSPDLMSLQLRGFELIDFKNINTRKLKTMNLGSINKFKNITQNIFPELRELLLEDVPNVLLSSFKDSQKLTYLRAVNVNIEDYHSLKYFRNLRELNIETKKQDKKYKFKSLLSLIGKLQIEQFKY